ncbi:MAG: class I SAM-dependent methyltransferase [Bacillota bacterium]|jgi:ubiquinone/menaquinone biosynthesis C-methylase UbiE|nr:class I SAM-dependent methyltransferase [Bacillota bacterium]NLL26126.1 class I SAM-dependent methyltransferase [Erysipelotrichia bacterium]
MIYKTLASYYDALVTDEEATQDWVDYTRKYVQKGKILDLACGSGDFAIALAKLGFVVEASDLSVEMIKVAESKKGSETVNWQVLNMLDLKATEKYDGITCYCDSINYLKSYQQLETLIDNVYKALKPNGVFMFDIHSLDTLKHFSQEYIEEGYIDDVTYQWCIYSNGDNLYYSFIFQNEDGMMLKEHHQQLVFNPDTVKKMLERKGFEVENSTDFISEGIVEGAKIFFAAIKK